MSLIPNDHQWRDTNGQHTSNLVCIFYDGITYDVWKKQSEKIYNLKPSFFNLTENTDALNSLNFHDTD